jgi:hypothetical protein
LGRSKLQGIKPKWKIKRKMVNRKVTLSLDEKTYKEFQNFCKENDIMLSKRIERLISEHLSKVKKGGKR